MIRLKEHRKHWLVKIFQILPYAIGGLIVIVLVILVLGYIGLLSPEQMESLERLGTGAITTKSH
jgi:hypothetical protein